MMPRSERYSQPTRQHRRAAGTRLNRSSLLSIRPETVRLLREQPFRNAGEEQLVLNDTDVSGQRRRPLRAKGRRRSRHPAPARRSPKSVYPPGRTGRAVGARSKSPPRGLRPDFPQLATPNGRGRVHPRAPRRGACSPTDMDRAVCGTGPRRVASSVVDAAAGGWQKVRTLSSGQGGGGRLASVQ